MAGGIRGNTNAVKYTDEMILDIADKLNKYIDENEIPIVAEFAYKNNIPIQTLYDLPIVSEVVKKCIAKKQSNLERKALNNQVNTTMAVFSLKQMGWSDKVETNNTHNLQGDLMQKMADLFIKDK